MIAAALVGCTVWTVGYSSAVPPLAASNSTRARRRVRHHVNPLKQGFLGVNASLVTLPPPPTPVEVELGCADARFLFERAAADPERAYVGVEIRRALVEQVNGQAQSQGLSQLQAIYANINTDLTRLFPEGRLARVFINFPDPWFKRAQHKRRLVTPQLGRELVPLLRPDGELFFQSDVFDLALDAMAVLEETPGLYNVRGEWSFWGPGDKPNLGDGNPYGACSLREVRVRERGLPVWRILYRRTGV